MKTSLNSARGRRTADRMPRKQIPQKEGGGLPLTLAVHRLVKVFLYHKALPYWCFSRKYDFLCLWVPCPSKLCFNKWIGVEFIHLNSISVKFLINKLKRIERFFVTLIFLVEAFIPV
jgi:hypothetical protein